MKINLGATPLDALYVGATKVYPSQAAPATGTPDAPVLAANLTWNAPADHGSAIIGYEIAHDPAITVTQNKPTYAGAVCKQDATHTIDYTALTITPATSMKVSGTTPFTDYTFKVRAINGNGAGAWSNEITAQFNFNEATGGTVSDVPNYNGTGETWRVHVFAADATLDVTNAYNPFRVLCVQGGHRGSEGQPAGGGVGGAGGSSTHAEITIPKGQHQATVGAAGGGHSSLLSITSNGGAAGGRGGSYGGSDYAENGADGQPYDITGAVKRYGAGGGGGTAYQGGDLRVGAGGRDGGGRGGMQGNQAHDATFYGGGGGGGGRDGGNNYPASQPFAGVVIVAYRIG